MKSGLPTSSPTSMNATTSISADAFLPWQSSEPLSSEQFSGELTEDPASTNVFTHGFVNTPDGMRPPQNPDVTVIQAHRISREGQAWVERGYGLHRLGNYEEAIVCFDTALELDTRIADAWQGKGICLGEMNESEGAIACFEQVILNNPDNYRGWHNRGKALMKVGRYEDAIGCFKRVLQLKPENYKAWYNRGLCLEHLRHWEQALNSFDQALSLKPNCYYAWSGRANTLMRMHRFDEAIYAFDRSIDLRSQNFPAWYGKAACYAAARQTLQAIGSLSQAMAYAPQAVRNLAKDDPAFNHMRHESAFQALFLTADSLSARN
jgi:tetratricopeptide (TPR) repeat protein